ncbi:MAG: hypothetical protein DRQ57_18565 [Gammaproteobacteria bacterium]|nr:MAG: hypothetical protein DRQ57_18565 [Gammaproteobacteria bacterium]
MKTNKILEHFFERGGDWMDRTGKWDGILMGDPEKDVDRCLVTWIPSLKALRYMVDNQIKLMICHEPLFWTNATTIEVTPETELKSDFIKDNDLTVMRLHNAWDGWPEIGTLWAWAKFLGLPSTPTAVSADGKQHRYDIDPVTVEELAKSIAKRCAPIGEPMVQLTGEASPVVSKIGLSTGIVQDLDEFLRMGCDCSVVCSDSMGTWNHTQKAEDRNQPVICVNLGTTQEPGMVSLSKYINDNIAGLAAEHLPHGNMFELIG